ncbi:hypothetical protein [Bradyrhizobium sp. USDA 4515]
MRLALTSSGLQPFELFVVSNPEIRARIRAAAWIRRTSPTARTC